MTIDLDALERLAAAASPGPWRADPEPGSVKLRAAHLIMGPNSHGAPDAIVGFDGLEEGDAAFIAAARQAVPELIQMVRKLRLCAHVEHDDWQTVPDPESPGETMRQCPWCGAVQL